MAKTKAIGPMNAPSQSKGKRSSSARMPCQQNQSITPRNNRNKLTFHPPLGPQHQIGQFDTQSTTTTHRTHHQCHCPCSNPCHLLRTSRCRCYPLCSTPTHGQEAPCPYPHHQSSN
jgi:hypothetical protein